MRKTTFTSIGVAFMMLVLAAPPTFAQSNPPPDPRRRWASQGPALAPDRARPELGTETP